MHLQIANSGPCPENSEEASELGLEQAVSLAQRKEKGIKSIFCYLFFVSHPIKLNFKLAERFLFSWRTYYRNHWKLSP